MSDIHTRLIKLASNLAKCNNMPSDLPEDWDFCKTTPAMYRKKVIRASEKSRAQCKQWAIEAKSIADDLRSRT